MNTLLFLTYSLSNNCEITFLGKNSLVLLGSISYKSYLEIYSLDNKEKLTFTVPTWDYIENLSFKLFMKIKESSFRPDLIAGISRGGLVPARIISDLYLAEGKKVTLSIMQVGFYSGVNKRQKEPIIYQDLPGHNLRNETVMPVKLW